MRGPSDNVNTSYQLGEFCYFICPLLRTQVPNLEKRVIEKEQQIHSLTEELRTTRASLQTREGTSTPSYPLALCTGCLASLVPKLLVCTASNEKLDGGLGMR